MKRYNEPMPAAGHQPAVQAGRPTTGRDDLVAILLTGVPQPDFTSSRLAETSWGPGQNRPHEV